MSVSVSPLAPPARPGIPWRSLRLAVLGPPAWLQSSGPPAVTAAYASRCEPVMAGADPERLLHAITSFAPTVTVVFDPACLPADTLRALPGTTLGVLVGGLPGDPGPALGAAADALDRVLSFRPELTRRTVGSTRVWRAVPPPVADVLFGAVAPLHDRPRTMTIGRATPHRERMLLPAMHHHDLLQIVHGVGGVALVELLRDGDVGVYVPPEAGPGVGAQVGIHLAAGQLLLAHALKPEHGLERGIDYLDFGSADELVWILDRLARFPEMHQRIRIRGRLKAEAFRASRLFARVAHDLLHDVAAFGAERRTG